MRPFTKEEMVQVAKAAGIHVGSDVKTYNTFGTLASIYTWGYESLNYDVSDNMFEVGNASSGDPHEYDILAVADTIKQIIKEREA